MRHKLFALEGGAIHGRALAVPAAGNDEGKTWSLITTQAHNTPGLLMGAYQHCPFTRLLQKAVLSC